MVVAYRKASEIRRPDFANTRDKLVERDEHPRVWICSGGEEKRKRAA
jgi:hypothetical protein